ncbi:uncharacterized protein LOC113869746 [Abrus precatorius]|uniref:Uncharacterized protein LOC113869746 n=1 Tax=Abrus precatorius TaxID=3816 RepID=A0A8B8M0F4_ABRPR|nr:uncharacterized protein LOC113869746 [Abrus precatorius]
MEVVVAVPPSTMDFNFDSNCSSPYITAPSSPQRFGNFFFSAPTSPIRTSNNSSLFNFNPRHSSASTSTVPQPSNDSHEDDFEFDFSGHLQRPSLSADELFHGGKIRPLKPPSLVSTPNKAPPPPSPPPQQQHNPQRGRASSFSIPSGRKGGRNSNSSVCESDDFFSQRSNTNTRPSETASTTHSSLLSSISFTKGYRKWRIKDFLLFRSASEGRATDRDPLRKYAVLSKTTAHEDVRNVSFRSTESAGSISRRRGPVSAHELHYTVNRAASEELKKKTFLPYKQGLLGCLGFNAGMHHISRRIGSMERS